MIRIAIGRRVQIIQLAMRLYRVFKNIQRLQAEGAASHELDELYAAAGKDIRESANRLCGAIVKAGQFLSLRGELFPEAFTKELQGLQDRVPSAPFPPVRTAIATACRHPVEEIFQDINPKPVASGSLAQVHTARLMDGRTVAVKVLRPGIEEIVRVDLSTLSKVARIFKHVPGLRRRMDFVALHKEFSNTLSRELDMNCEANHMDRFRETLARDSRIVMPDVIREHTSTRMLVMTFMEGANIRDTERLKSWNIDRERVRDALLDVYLQQLMVTGFVHLDPHPGNLLVTRSGKLALLDFGMVAEYSAHELTAFRNLAQRIFLHDFEGAARVLQELGYLSSDSDVASFLHSLDPLPSQFDGETIRRLLAHEGFRLQARYMLLIRCIGMLKTALTILTPDETDWTAVLSSHALPILMNPNDAFAEETI